MTDTLISPKELVHQLEWRYAVKKFDASKKIPPEVWAELEKCLLLSASSYGLEPYKFVLVMDPALRKKLTPGSFNQSRSKPRRTSWCSPEGPMWTRVTSSGSSPASLKFAE